MLLVIHWFKTGCMITMYLGNQFQVETSPSERFSPINCGNSTVRKVELRDCLGDRSRRKAKKLSDYVTCIQFLITWFFLVDHGDHWLLTWSCALRTLITWLRIHYIVPLHFVDSSVVFFFLDTEDVRRSYLLYSLTCVTNLSPSPFSLRSR